MFSHMYMLFVVSLFSGRVLLFTMYLNFLVFIYFLNKFLKPKIQSFVATCVHKVVATYIISYYMVVLYRDI